MPRSSVSGAVNVLGPLEVVVAGRAIRLRPAQRRLLAIMHLDPRATLDRDTLIDRMWGEEAPATAAAALGVHLSGIRKAAPGLVATTDAGYRPDTAAYRSDRDAFERAAARAGMEASDGAWAQVLRTTSKAMTAWRGTPYPELQGDEFAAADVARLLATWDAIDDLRARALLAVARPEEAVIEIRGLVARHPLREPLWEHLIVALARMGRHAEALQAFEDARRTFAEELGVEPGPALVALRDGVVHGEEGLGEPARGAATNLPLVRSSFVGREEELQRLGRLLGSRRLVTIVGAPGLGKTRLAIEAGRTVLDAFPDGVWLVRLAEARTDRDAATAIGHALGLGSQAIDLTDMADRLARRRALLVLDNCEHLGDACAAFARRVMERPGSLHVLATSRRPIGLPEEARWRLAALPVPAGGATAEGAALLGSAAVRMFLDRARSADPGFRITPETAPQVAALCRYADGIPLVLELAAAWVPALGLTDITDMLAGGEAPRRAAGDRPGHQRSLKATLEWSVALLPPEDRELFVALAAFRGPFGLEDAAGVCPVEGDRRRTAAAIARLVDASLLVVERRDDGRVVYRQLVPVRTFARERLEARRGWAALRRRFVDHYLGKATRMAPDPFRAVVDLAAIDDDLDNLREAFALGLEAGRADDVALAIASLNGYFRNRMLAREERDWLNRLLPAIEDPSARVRALLAAGMAAQATNELDEALDRLTEARDAAAVLGDETALAGVLIALAGLHSNRGSWAAGIEAARAGHALAAAQDNPSGLGGAVHFLGVNLAYSGAVQEGADALAEAARLFVATGELGRASHSLSTLTYLGVVTNDEGLARRWADEAVERATASGSTVRLVRALGFTAALEATWGDVRTAAGRLREVDRRMRAEANEVAIELLLPAGALARRLEHWSLLAHIVAAVEAAFVATGQGYPLPWRAMLAAWDRDARAGLGVAVADAAPTPLDLESVRDEVRALLVETAGAD